MFGKVRDIYRSTLTEKDRFWDKVMGRPVCSVLVYLIKNTDITPNQLTLYSYFFMVVSGLILIFRLTYAGLITATLVYYFSFVLDGVDGQLARLKGMQSKFGELLDSLFDGTKALVIVATVSLRLFFIHQNSLYLILGITGVFLVATAVMLTRFARTEEYLNSAARIKNYQPQDNAGPLQAAIKMLEKIGKFLIYYPGYIIYFSIFNKIEWFLYIYIGTYVFYTAKIFLSTAVVINKT